MNDYIESPFIRTYQERAHEQARRAQLVGWIVFLATAAALGWTVAIVSVCCM